MENEALIVLVAHINEGIVDAIHVVAQAVIDEGGEDAALELVSNLYGGQPSEYVVGSVDGSIRYNRPMHGDIFDAKRDAFIAPKPFGSWILNESTYIWEAPIPYPNDSAFYIWDESLGDWVEVV